MAEKKPAGAGIDGNSILERLAAARKGDRGKVNLYLDRKLYGSFKSHCDDAGIPMSVVLEELLREFMASLGSKKPKKG